MLTTARARMREGLDVAAAVIETHGRSETEALIEGLDVLPRRVVDYKGGKLEEMDLDEMADKAAVRVRYLELVKRFHPDSNGGDRSTEQKLGRVLRAYKTLKAAKLV